MTVYRKPLLLAAVVVEKRGEWFMLDFLAKGSSQVKRNGKVVGHTRRNPDRTELANELLDGIRDDFPKATSIGARVGSGPYMPIHGPSKSPGNFRFQMWLRVPRVSLARFLDVLGLHESEVREPPRVEWPAELTR
jgi:hypothetical protein